MAQETDIEKYLIKRVAQIGGMQAKFTSPGSAGHPDRLVKLPGHPAALVELKRPGPSPEPLQLTRMAEWSAVGMLATWASTYAEVERFLQRVRTQ